MKRLPTRALYILLSSVAFACFISIFVLYFIAKKEIRMANEWRLKSFLLADELRQSSDDLTRMVRTYIATGNPIYKQHYQEILDIREGKKPRPFEAYNVYWDLVLTDDKRPREFGPAIPLITLMRQTGFTEQEFATLERAKSASDALTRTEYAAMALIEADVPNRPSKRERAIEMLTDAAYHEAKAAIMRPIGRFHRLVARRTTEAVRQAEKHANGIGILLGVSAVVLLFLLWGLIDAVNRRKRIKVKNEALKESERKYRFIAENSGDVIWTIDLASERFSYVSPSVYQLRGYTVDEIMAQPLAAALTPESFERVRGVLLDAMSRWQAGDRSDTRIVTELDQPHKDGRIMNTEVVTTLHGDAEGNAVSVLGISRDVTERKREQNAIRTLAFLDELTQLPNRRLLLDRLRQSITRAKRDHSRIALLFIDLDRFKPINDSLGHQVGDWVLQTVAQRIMGCLRASDTAARIGGDEFVVVLPDLLYAEDSTAVAERVRLELEKPILTSDGTRVEISSSIGIAVYPDHAEDENDLLRLSDQAMYLAKNAGRNAAKLLPIDRNQTRAKSFIEKGTFVRVVWRPAYACGNDTIDKEHRALFRLADRLLNAKAHADVEPTEFKSAFDVLLSQIKSHFENEEAILRRWGYQQVEEHAAIHRSLLNRALELRRRADDGDVPDRELVDFVVVEMVAEHMLRSDSDFFRLFRQKDSDTIRLSSLQVEG